MAAAAVALAFLLVVALLAAAGWEIRPPAAGTSDGGVVGLRSYRAGDAYEPIAARVLYAPAAADTARRRCPDPERRVPEPPRAGRYGTAEEWT